jgi:pimeloyl-ACP methyl ester carboxylesterase
MDVRSRLIPVRVPRAPEGVVLVLHGGGARTGGVRVSPTQLSVLRMIPIARRIARTGRRRLAVYRLLNSTRGWDTDHTPVDDVHWALGAVREQLGGELPIGLVGHSLGGRAAVLAAGEQGVRSVVALAPFVYPQDADDVAAPDREFLFVHGTRDRIASPARSLDTARRLRRQAAVEFVSVDGGKHAMLRKHGAFSGPAADFAVRTLLTEPDGVRTRPVSKSGSGAE